MSHPPLLQGLAPASDPFAGPGEMRALCRALDWAATPLGAVEGWSQSLRTTTGIVLGSRNPMFLFWGPELVQIYNDAYRPSLGAGGAGGRHPRALGMRGREFWTDIWDEIGPQIDQVLSTGEATWHEDQYLPIERNGRREDVWWTYSYGPVQDDDGRINGVLVVCQETTSRVVAAQAVRESEGRLRAIYDGTYEYIGLLDPAGTMLDCNRAALEFAGNSRGDVIGREFWTTPWFASTPGAAELARRGIERAAAGESVRHELTLRRPDGGEMTFDFSLHPIRDAEGRVQYIVPEGRDISDRRRAEDALRESEARYRRLFESMDEGFCVIEVNFDDAGQPVDYTFLETNPAFEHHTGFVDAVGKRVRELAPGHEPFWWETYARVVATGEPIRFDAGAAALGRWYDVNAFRIGDPREHRVAVLFKDVSAEHAAAAERDKLLSELAVERSRLAEVFRQAPSFLAILRGPSHVFELVNDAYYGLVGHRDILGKPILEALPEVQGQGFVELLDRVLETGEPYVGREVRVKLARTPGGPAEDRYADFVYQPVVDADGARTGVVAHGHDVTAQVLARRDVEVLLAESEAARAESEAARAEAEAANRVKAEFLTIMSHELRTPLNAISGYTELLEMGLRGPLNEAQRQDLERIRLSQRHLLGLINEVLNFAKLETGAVQFDIGDVEVEAVVSAAGELVAPQAREKGIELGLSCPEQLVARTDREKFRQILVNLLSNAVKFTDAGGRIDVACAARADRVAVEVRDTGIGIAEDKHEVIFDPFVQVRSDRTRLHEGTGLGLAISRDLARSMGGEITVRSAPGEGSVFTLQLPLS